MICMCIDSICYCFKLLFGLKLFVHLLASVQLQQPMMTLWTKTHRFRCNFQINQPKKIKTTTNLNINIKRELRIFLVLHHIITGQLCCFRVFYLFILLTGLDMDIIIKSPSHIGAGCCFFVCYLCVLFVPYWMIFIWIL